MTLQFGHAISSQRLAFDSADRVSIDNISMRPISCNEDGWVMGMDDGSGCARQFTHQELNQYAAQGRLTHQIGYFLPHQARARLKSAEFLISALSKRDRVAFAKRDAWVLAYFDLQKDGMKITDASIEAHKAKLLEKVLKFTKESRNHDLPDKSKTNDFCEAPSARTLRRWVKQYRETGAAGLADRIAARGNRGHRMTPAEISLMMQEVRGYMSETRPTEATIVENVTRAFEKRNAELRAEGQLELRAPSRSTVRKAIKSLDLYQVTVARHGLDYARKNFAPVGNGLMLTRPLERVEIDEYRVDAITLMASSGLDGFLNEDERKALGLDGSKARWIITVAICATTRCIVGMSISREASGSAAKQVLQMVVSDKGKWADAVGAQGSWDMHGRPELIATDNGTAFISETFRAGCADLGVAHEFTPPATPEMRARIERLFRTIAVKLLRRLAGHTFSSILEKGNADPKARAALTFDDFAFAMVRWIVDIYHNQPHRGLGGETPLTCWRRLMKEYGVAPSPSNREYRLIFGVRHTRKLDQSGIMVQGLRYHSDELARWMLPDGEVELEVAWHPRDIGAILVYLGGEWVEVPALDERYRGVAAQTWLTAARQLKSANPRRKEFDHDTIFAAIKAIEDRNAQAMALAGLLVEEWTEEKLARAEKRLFMGFRESTRTPSDVAPAADGKPGMSIPSPEKEETAAKPKRKRKGKSSDWNVED
ncbi:MAG: DDE-type integrase/transposase/recombinase [Rhodobacteraceae bacterium]|nr:DDE-type integrase/transposase/recombinase [Paracoccaceae bacterium]